MQYIQKITGSKGLMDNCLQNETLTFAYNKIRLLEPLISADMLDIADSLTTSFIGLEYSVKTASSISDKLERQCAHNPQAEPIELLSYMKDIIRYTEICQHDQIIEIARQTIDALKDRGYILSGISNYYVTPYPNTGYQGLHLNFITPYGQEIELQVHSNKSFEVKQEGHALYEKMRAVATPIQEKEKLKEEIVEIHQGIKKPQNFESLPYKYMLENKDKIIAKRRIATEVCLETTRLNNRPCASVYEVFVNGKKFADGFEIRYSDNSVCTYINNRVHHIAKYCALTKDEITIQQFPCVSRNFSLAEVIEMTRQTEYTNQEWMLRNMSEKMKEDLNLSNHPLGVQQNQIDINKTIELDDREL